jgi:hypothetical protein
MWTQSSVLKVYHEANIWAASGMCIQTITNICSSYILEGLAQVRFDYTYGQIYVCTVPPKSCRTDFFKNQTTHEEVAYLFSIRNKLHWHIYRLLQGHTVSEKLPKINLFGPSLIHRLRLLGSQQHPQSGSLLTSFSTWGTEYSMAEINLESTGGGEGL